LGVHGRAGGELELELARVRQGGELPVEGQLPLIEGAAEQRHELAPGAGATQRAEGASPILSTWPLPRPTDWLQIVNQPQTEAEVAALRCCVNRGRPFGDPNWVTDTAKRLGLEWTIRPRGRPKKQS